MRLRGFFRTGAAYKYIIMLFLVVFSIWKLFTIAVPRDALVLRHNGSFVFRVNDENIAEQIAVEIGDSAGDLVAVTGPLEAGDRVAIRGAENLQEGASVKIMTSQGTTGKASSEG